MHLELEGKGYSRKDKGEKKSRTCLLAEFHLNKNQTTNESCKLEIYKLYLKIEEQNQKNIQILHFAEF